MPWNALWISFALFSRVLNVYAQSSNITQCIPSYQWSLNALGQTPCLVAAYLESACSTTPFAVDGIPVDNHYLPPTFAGATPCICSTVTYSMISACGGCQNRTFTTWGNWSMNCPVIEFTAFPKAISPATQVPSWAYLNISLTNNNFDALVAQSTLGKSSTSSSTTSSGTSASLSSSTNVPATSVLTTPTDTVGSSHSNAGAIAGGVVGGLVFLAVIALLVFWFFIRRRHWRSNVTVDLDGHSSIPPLMQETSTMRDGPSPLSSGQTPYIYGSSDTSPYPTSPTTSAFYTTGPISRRSLETVSQYGSQAPRGYTGAAEI